MILSLSYSFELPVREIISNRAENNNDDKGKCLYYRYSKTSECLFNLLKKTILSFMVNQYKIVLDVTQLT